MGVWMFGAAALEGKREGADVQGGDGERRGELQGTEVLCWWAGERTGTGSQAGRHRTAGRQASKRQVAIAVTLSSESDSEIDNEAHHQQGGRATSKQSSSSNSHKMSHFNGGAPKPRELFTRETFLRVKAGVDSRRRGHLCSLARSAADCGGRQSPPTPSLPPSA